RSIVGKDGFCNIRFQGQVYDDDIQLCYNRFRWYDDVDGRYISKDPIGLLSGEYNLYVYVDDPNGWVDAFGLAGNSYRSANKKVKEKFKKALDDIENGNGIPRRNTDGSQKEYQGRERGSHKWAGSLEYELGDGDNNNRILKRIRTTTNGDSIVDYGFTATHYEKIAPDIDKIVVRK
ncbi:RHS repeat-associated core domain-containing protein, partial [Tenacibaculum maritimum]